MRKMDYALLHDVTNIPAFVNNHRIKQEDIQKITTDKKGNPVILYWREA